MLEKAHPSRRCGLQLRQDDFCKLAELPGVEGGSCVAPQVDGKVASPQQRGPHLARVRNVSEDGLGERGTVRPIANGVRLKTVSPGELRNLNRPDRAEGLSHAEEVILVEVARDERTGRSRSEEHTSELQSLMRISYAVFCLKKK